MDGNVLAEPRDSSRGRCSIVCGNGERVDVDIVFGTLGGSVECNASSWCDNTFECDGSLLPESFYTIALRKPTYTNKYTEIAEC